MREWRSRGYMGVSRDTATLLSYWRSETDGLRPFFCQIEAMETLVWLCEADEHVNPELAGIRGRLRSICKTYNEDILRYATKMATGTGKTMVMGMLIAWLSICMKKSNILVIAPNLTVRDRLFVLIPQKGSIYETILPKNMRLDARLVVRVENFQKFQLNDTLEMGGSKLNKIGRGIILNGEKSDNGRWIEEPSYMLRRILPEFRNNEKVTVISDECHHCYFPDIFKSNGNGNKKRKVKKDNETKESNEWAALWFSILRYLRNEERLGTVFDMSATPMFLYNIPEKDIDLFPWTVSDYPLIEAIEAGLTKIPRVPVSDNTEQYEPKFRNVFKNATKKSLEHNKMEPLVSDLLGRMHEKYTDTDTAYSKSVPPITPVMIIVANDIANATALYKHIAGYKDGTKWKRGAYDIFSNVNASGPVENPPTVLVHSQLDDKKWEKLADIQSALFSDDNVIEKSKKAELIKSVFQTVGKKGESGEHIRCVISVSMLTEGWDVKTVTHIFGFRPFKSQLLCEQVAGRALRRTRLPVEGEMGAEYAGIYGIPFDFMLGDGGPSKPPSDNTWTVYTMPDRYKLRVSFPNIKAYYKEMGTTVCSLNPAKVKQYTVDKPLIPTKTTVKGLLGGKSVLYSDVTPGTAIYAVAKQVTDVLCETERRRRLVFASAVNAVEEWIRHPRVRCDDVRFLIDAKYIDTVSHMIAKACSARDDKGGIYPIFYGNDPADRDISTGDVWFDTSTEHRYPREKNKHKFLKKSELNAAACHSDSEVLVAEVLDKHPDISAWARNMRLGWNIPYVDKKTGVWKSYEPDFVAHVKDTDYKLVIEFKGQEDEDALNKMSWTQDWWIPAVSNSDDPACNGRWKYVYIKGRNEIDGRINSAIARCKK